MWIRVGFGVGERSLRFRSRGERDLESFLSRTRRPREPDLDLRFSLSALERSWLRLSFDFVETSFESFTASFAGLFDLDPDLRFALDLSLSLLDEEDELDEELLELEDDERDPDDDLEELLSELSKKYKSLYE